MIWEKMKEKPGCYSRGIDATLEAAESVIDDLRGQLGAASVAHDAAIRDVNHLYDGFLAAANAAREAAERELALNTEMYARGYDIEIDARVAAEKAYTEECLKARAAERERDAWLNCDPGLTITALRADNARLSEKNSRVEVLTDLVRGARQTLRSYGFTYNPAFDAALDGSTAPAPCAECAGKAREIEHFVRRITNLNQEVLIGNTEIARLFDANARLQSRATDAEQEVERLTAAARVVGGEGRDEGDERYLEHATGELRDLVGALHEFHSYFCGHGPHTREFVGKLKCILAAIDERMAERRAKRER